LKPHEIKPCYSLCGRPCIRGLPGHGGPLQGLINYWDTKSKCRHLNNWPVKGLCTRCLSEFIEWRYSQSLWYFRPSFVNCCPYPLLSVSTCPPPLPCELVHLVWCIHVYGVYCVRGGGVLVLRQINTCRKVLLQRWHILHCPLWVFPFYGQHEQQDCQENLTHWCWLNYY
jgi:hypothetical protein